MRVSVEADENGDPFEVWLVKRSFALMAPVCRMGLAICLLFLCVADPLYYLLDLWSRAVPHSWFLIWHLIMAAFFASVLLACPRARTHGQRQHFLLAFVASVTLLFAWFGVVSWLGTGDLSMLAIAEILIAAVFFLPGYLRRWSYGLQALGTGLVLAWLDRSGKFLGQMHFTNLVVIATVALAMDRFMWRNARLLFTEKCRVARAHRRSDAVLHNALPLRIAEELKTHRRVQARSHPAMSILFADIVGFTDFAAQRSPEQVLDTLNALFSEIDALVDLHQVEKIKTIGDAYMAVSQTRPQALAGLALSMLDAMQRFNAQKGLSLAWRIGMHCGPTIAGVIGHKRFLYDVWGDAVNLASRMESGGEPGRIHTSEALYLALQQGFAFEARGLVFLKGKGFMPTYFLLGEKAHDEGAQAP